MIKFLLGIVIVVAASLIGRALARNYLRRKRFFAQMEQFNQRFLAEISYYRRPLFEVYAQYSYEGEFQELLESFFLLQKQGETLKNASLLDLSAFSFLDEEDRRAVGDYFLTIGRGNTVSQKEYFSTAEKMLSKYREQSEIDCKKHVDLYTKLGFLAGLAILILIL